MNHEKSSLKALQPASTVILIRPNGDGFQVYLLKRSIRSTFMPGYYVFPGGTVATEDREVNAWKAHVDLDPATMMHQLGGNLSPEEILPYGVAAIRETLEEAGVLLAFRKGQQKGDRTHFSEMVLKEKHPEDWFQRQVETRDWTLMFSRLYRWARWITPKGMKRRFDTRFFITFLPPDQVCRPDRRETKHGIWVDPQEGLAGNMAAKVPLSPPTLITLYELGRFKSFQQLVNDATSRPWGETRRPHFIKVGREAIILQPWDRQHGQEKINIDIRKLEESILPIDEPCSRIWCQKGIWRAVSA
jgi:8-oxo-dGTP pyrophosphatase MutT (NUDIX family)